LTQIDGIDAADERHKMLEHLARLLLIAGLQEKVDICEQMTQFLQDFEHIGIQIATKKGQFKKFKRAKLNKLTGAPSSRSY
jgi:hypothetical protein